MNTKRQLEQFWQWSDAEDPGWEEAITKIPDHLRDGVENGMVTVAEYHDINSDYDVVWNDDIYRSAIKTISFALVELEAAKTARENLTGE